MYNQQQAAIPDEYFDITAQQFLLTINQLNIQSSLSKSQLNALSKNGYAKSKVNNHICNELDNK